MLRVYVLNAVDNVHKQIQSIPLVTLFITRLIEL